MKTMMNKSMKMIRAKITPKKAVSKAATLCQGHNLRCTLTPRKSKMRERGAIFQVAKLSQRSTSTLTLLRKRGRIEAERGMHHIKSLPRS